MTTPPNHNASITNSSSATSHAVDGAEANLSQDSLSWGAELPSTYELLRREGELHEGRGTVLDELHRNLVRLQDLHSQLHFLMREVESTLRR